MSRLWVIHQKCNLWPKFVSMTRNFNTIKTVSLNFALSFAKANQNMRLCKRHLENIEKAFSYTQTMPFFAKSSIIYPKLQHNKDFFTKLWIVICKSLSKYDIMPKIAKKYWVHPELYRKQCHFWSKFASLTQNFKATKTVLPNFGLPFAKAYQMLEMNFFETFQKVAKPAKMKRQTKKITMGTHIRSGPFLPRKALWNGKNKFYQIVSFYTPMDAEFHDEQLLLKSSR